MKKQTAKTNTTNLVLVTRVFAVANARVPNLLKQAQSRCNPTATYGPYGEAMLTILGNNVTTTVALILNHLTIH